ncbi:hypothetical protein [Thermohalobacter berrensis]|uniref:DUF975 domain-containing protein n=1 Tax=Thermohalobacter berrensis TaxID=99594 RepID=A0A419T550_9FIRM|nr:hypothetical protein [Thermohalobacter berrensis]RKD32572.1 hypothetical protein BET03_10885 [Thermohalobacter berrensis]
MEILRDLYYTNRLTAKKTYKLFLANWPIIFTGFVYTIINIILFSVISFLFTGVLRLLAGIVIALATSSLVSNYLYLLSNIIKYDKFTLHDFKLGFKAFLWKVYGVLVIGWIAGLLFQMALAPILYRIIPSGILSLIISLLVFVFLNPLPETIYQKFYSPWETIVYSFEFIKENWLEWFIPNIVLIYLIYLTTGTTMTTLFPTQVFMGFDFSLKGILLYLLGQILFSFTMIYRGKLFETLSTSTRRKRLFMRDFYN